MYDRAITTTCDRAHHLDLKLQDEEEEKITRTPCMENEREVEKQVRPHGETTS